MSKLYSTESVNPDTYDIDLCSSLEIVQKINAEDQKVAVAVQKILPTIAQTVEVVVDCMQKGGRLLYVGCGTSGRIGVLDASECPPTYGVSPSLVVGIIAGGDAALRNAIEGAEDDGEAGERAMIDHGVCARDVVIGLSASGQAEYVYAALRKAKQLGAYTVMVCNAQVERLQTICDAYLYTYVGPEAICGSSRMKAGTSEKMILNMISTATMVRLGKTYHNLMVDMIPSNKKLIKRSARIVSTLANVDEEEARSYLAQANGNTKTALVMALTGVAKEQAEEALSRNGGVARRAVEFLLTK